jgi:exosortase
MEKKLLALGPLGSRVAVWSGLVLASFILAYWSTFSGLTHTWATDPIYSHGFFIPVFSAVVLWMRRGQLKPELLRPSAWGLVWILAAALVRLSAAYFFLPWFGDLSLIPTLIGIALLLGGGHCLRWAWPSIAFLVFMLPLPFSIKWALSDPLQRIATLASTYTLQTIGLPALSKGNIIIVDDVSLGVEEACNGLGMLVVFFALATALAFVLDVPLWEKGLLVLSAVPVALLSNIGRIVLTGGMSQIFGAKVAHVVFHDWGGWLMMPLALALLGLEIRLLSWVLVAPATVETMDRRVPLMPGQSNGKAPGARARPAAVDKARSRATAKGPLP